MTGHGESHGAISVMNAIPCGIGSTIGIDLLTEADFSSSDHTHIDLVDRPEMNTGLVRTCVKRTLDTVGAERFEYNLSVKTQIPPSMGLKSSSSVCNAVISAVLDHLGVKMDMIDIIRLGVQCAKDCKVTITGAFDDACGCGLGGLVVTDNSSNELILRKEIPEYDVVICIPDWSIPKSKVPVDKYHELSDAYRELVPKLENSYLEVLTRNGEMVENIIGNPSGISKKAMELGALAAGVTGTGPAISVVTERGKGKDLAAELGCRTMITRTI